MDNREQLIEAVANSRIIDRMYPSKDAVVAALRAKKPFKIYLGVDPTGPHIHLGHLSNFLVLRKLQELGCEIIFLIGDFTARIGDPTDKLAARQPLSEAEIKENYRLFKEQASRILDFKGKQGVKVEFNAKWLAKMNLADVIDLASSVTVQQMIERDMFQERMKMGKPIGLHEFLYPLMQGYDSVAMNVDAEIGGTDQTFNMLMGRELLKKHSGKEKFVITTKLLINPETGKKIMNKSEGGLINLDDEPADMFGKVMAIRDDAMFAIAELSTEMPDSEISSLRSDFKKGKNPKDIKIKIAEVIVSTIYGEREAVNAKEHFEQAFSKHEIPDDAPALKLKDKKMTVLDLVVASGVLKSKSEARRLIEQGGFELAEKVYKDPQEEIVIRGGETVRIGKKTFFRLA